MRALEAIVLALSFLALFAAFPFKKALPRIQLGTWSAAMFFVALQALVEKTRWQLFPAYLILAFLTIPVFSTWRRRNQNPSAEKRRRWPRIVGIIFGSLTLGLSALLATQLPVFTLPRPTGPHAIGVTSYEWIDLDRPDEHPKTPSGHRRLVVNVWYPAAPSTDPAEPYLDKLHAEGLARALKLPGFALNHLPLVPTHAHRDIALPTGNEKYPVVLFSHGYPMPSNSGTFATEELASHGYVVFAINHTYDTAFVVFQDGTNAAVESLGDVGRIEAVEKILGPRVAVWVADARFVLNEVTKLDTADARFKGRLDLDRVGYFGHSFGGASAFATLMVDARFKAAINMDGALFGVSAQARPKQPYMLLNGDKIVVTDAQLARTGANRQEVEAFLEGVEANWSASVAPGNGLRQRARIAGATHLSFSDVPLMVPMTGGTIPTSQAHELVNQYIRSFFAQNLRNQANPSQ